MEQDFNIEEEYEKYKASQQGPDTRPEWMKLAEEDLKGFLDKPEFRLSAELVNWLNNKTSCPHCGKVISALASKSHTKTCKSNYDTILKLLTKDPDITIADISRITGFSNVRINNIYKTNGLIHKFSNPVDFNNHEKHRHKYLKGCKKGGKTQGEKTIIETKNKFQALWNKLPNEIFTMQILKVYCHESGIKRTQTIDRFKNEGWLNLVHEGTPSSSNNPNLYVKNPDKSEDPNYQPVIVSEFLIQEKLKDIKERFSEQMKINRRGTDKN
jgi:hypothetical protein